MDRLGNDTHLNVRTLFRLNSCQLTLYLMSDTQSFYIPLPYKIYQYTIATKP